jgi:hypothetical protein
MGQNFARDPNFLIWAAGDAAAPSHYKITGAPTIARETGASNIKYKMSAKLTGSATGRIVQTILNTTDFPTSFRGIPFSFGCWIKTDTASIARVVLDDGVGQGVSGYAPGTSTWTWVTGTRTLDASATKIEVQFESLSATAVTYFDGWTIMLGSIPPQHFIKARPLRGALIFPFPDVAAVGTNKARYFSGRPFRVENVSLHAVTAPATQALIVDVNHWDGSAFTSMFSTRPQIAAAANNGGADPDGTYRYRCFKGLSNAEALTDGLLDVDIDQVGTGTPGSNITVIVRTLQFQDPFESFRGTASYGNE